MAANLRVIQLLNLIGEVLVEQTRTSLISYDLKNSRLIEAVTYEVDETKLEVSLILPRYAAYVITGRRAGAKAPPELPILNWIKRKGIRPRRTKSGKPQTVEQLTNAIRFGIKYKGIKPRPFAERAVSASLKTADRLVGDKFSFIVDDLIQDAFKKI